MGLALNENILLNGTVGTIAKEEVVFA